MIVDMLTNKKPNLVVTELFIGGRKLNISLLFITIMQSYFAEPKNIRLNSTHYFIMKIPNKWELQQIAFNHSSDIDFKDFMNIYKKWWKMKNYNMILTEKQQKYQRYHHVKLINMNILHVKQYYLLIKEEW